MDNRDKIFTLTIVLCAIAVYLFVKNIEQDYSSVYVPNTTEWFETEIEVYFNDETKQDYKIDVYENLDNIKVDNGNLSYTKCTKRTGGVIAYKVELASFVKNYIVRKSEFKTKSE